MIHKCAIFFAGAQFLVVPYSTFLQTLTVFKTKEEATQGLLVIMCLLVHSRGAPE